MIETLLATIIGFVGSIVPEIFKSYNENQDRKHEKDILEMQLAAQQSGQMARLEEIGAVADIDEEARGGQRIDNIVAHPIVDFGEHVGARRHLADQRQEGENRPRAGGGHRNQRTAV